MKATSVSDKCSCLHAINNLPISTLLQVESSYHRVVLFCSLVSCLGLCAVQSESKMQVKRHERHLKSYGLTNLRLHMIVLRPRCLLSAETSAGGQRK